MSAVHVGKQIGRGAYLAEKEGKKIIIKIPPPSPKKILTRVRRMLFGKSISYKNELEVNKRLQLQKFKGIRFPCLLAGDDEMLQFEYLSGEEVRPSQNSEQWKMLIRGIKAFNKGEWWPRRREKVSNILANHPFHHTIILLFRAPINLALKLKSLKIFVSYVIKCKLSPKVILHNDLTISNLFILNSGELALLDFENVVTSKFFILSDIVNVSISYDPLSIPVADIRDYYLSLAGIEKTCQKTEMIIRKEIQACVIKNILHRIVSKKTPFALKQVLQSFLEKNILEEENFNLWIETNNQV